MIDELSGVLRRPKFAGILTDTQIEAFVDTLEEVAVVVDDPDVVDLDIESMAGEADRGYDARPA